MDLLPRCGRRGAKSLNNMLKNLVIWLVIGLVLMTVFNQFNTRQAAQAPMEYSAVHGGGEGGPHRQGHDRGPPAQGDRPPTGKRVTSYSPGRHLAGLRPAQVRRQGRGQARRGAVAPHEHLRLVVPDAAADRRVDLLHAPDAGRRARRRVLASASRARACSTRPTTRSPSPTSPAATRRRKKWPSSSTSCATRPSSRSSAAASRAAC